MKFFAATTWTLALATMALAQDTASGGQSISTHTKKLNRAA